MSMLLLGMGNFIIKFRLKELRGVKMYILFGSFWISCFLVFMRIIYVKEGS